VSYGPFTNGELTRGLTCRILEVNRLAAENKKYREALMYYAFTKDTDNGEKARVALDMVLKEI